MGHPGLLSAEGYTQSNRILMFEVHNNRSGLDVHLFIGPGPDSVRQRLLDMARANPDVFLMPRSTSGPYVPIYSVSLLEPGAYETLDKEGRESELRRQWGAFLDEHLPRIEDALEREAWIWETPAS